MQDFAALDALEASHYASKHDSASGNAFDRLPAFMYQSNSANNQQAAPTRQVSGMQACGVLGHAPDAAFSLRPDLTRQESTAGAATAPLFNMPPAAATSMAQSGSNQQLRQQQHQPRSLAQTSLQAFMAACSGHADSQQAWRDQAAPASIQQRAQHAFITGANAVGSSCIDLTSDQHPAAAATSVPGDTASTMAVDAQQAQASFASAEPAGINFFEDAVDDDDVGTDGLMECSINLLKAGIRVHKYSIAFCCQSYLASCCVLAL